MMPMLPSFQVATVILPKCFSFPLYQSMNVAQNLSFPLKTRDASMSHADIHERVITIARELEIESILNRSANAISLLKNSWWLLGVPWLDLMFLWYCSMNHLLPSSLVSSGDCDKPSSVFKKSWE